MVMVPILSVSSGGFSCAGSSPAFCHIPYDKMLGRSLGTRLAQRLSRICCEIVAIVMLQVCNTAYNAVGYNKAVHGICWKPTHISGA